MSEIEKITLIRVSIVQWIEKTYDFAVCGVVEGVFSGRKPAAKGGRDVFALKLMHYSG